MRGGERGKAPLESVPPSDQFEETTDLLGKHALAAKTRSEACVVQSSATERFDALQDFLPAQGTMSQKPVVEEFSQAMGQAKHDVAREPSAGRGG